MQAVIMTQMCTFQLAWAGQKKKKLKKTKCIGKSTFETAFGSIHMYEMPEGFLGGMHWDEAHKAPPPPLGIGDGPYICPLCIRAVRNKLRQACNPSGGSGAGEWCRLYFSVVHYFTTCPGISYNKGDFTVLYSINITECAHAISFFYSGDYVSHVMVTWLLQSL